MLSLKTGKYHLALSQGAGKPVPVPPVDIQNPITLEAGYTTRAPIRAAGWAVLALGSASGIGAMITGIGILEQHNVSSDNDEPVGSGTIIGGAITTALSIIVGAILAATKDKAKLVVVDPQAKNRQSQPGEPGETEPQTKSAQADKEDEPLTQTSTANPYQ